MHLTPPVRSVVSRWRTLATGAVLLPLALAACGGDGKGPPPVPVVASLQLVAGNAQTGTVGEALADSLVVRALDADAQPISGMAVSWAVTGGGGTITGSTTTDATGLARARWTMGSAAGDATARAASGAQSASFTASANPGLAAVVQLQPGTLSLEAGQQRQYQVVVRDAFSNPITGRPVGWSTSQAQVAAVDASGLVTALAPGSTQVRATVEGQVGFAALTVTGNPALQPTLTAITPDVLTPGATATVTGSNFNPNPGATAITVNGASANVTVQSATQLQFVVPSAAAMGCAPAGTAEVSVTVAGLSAKRAHAARAGTAYSLAVGDTLHSRANAPLGCIELPGGSARYLVTVTNPGPYVGTGGLVGGRGMGVQMRSATAQVSTAQATSSAAASPAPRTLALSARAERAREHIRAHMGVLERAWQAIPPGGQAPRTAAPTGARASLTAAPPNVGDSIWIRYPDPTKSNPCVNFDSIRARVVNITQRAIVLEDVIAPLRGQVDSMYVKLAQEFDTLQYGIVKDYFEDPLVLDPRTNADGKLYMLFTKRVNNYGAAGFVWPGDLLDRTTCPQSNTAEIFYGIVPTILTGSGAQSDYTPAEWFFYSRGTVVHEVKHIASVASRLNRNPAPAFYGDSIWLEEATAQAAEELWARHVFGYTQNGNTGYAQSVGCELTCADKPFVMINHFAFLWDYYASSETRSVLGKVTSDDASFYGSAWSFLRWVADHSALGEKELFRQLTAANTAGLTSITNLTGRPYEQLMREFTLANALDDRTDITGVSSRYTHPSWNIRDIFRGLNANFGQFFPTAFPLNVRTVGTTPITIGEIRAGGAAYFDLQVNGPARAFHLLAPHGAELDAGTPLRVTVVRIN